MHIRNILPALIIVLLVIGCKSTQTGSTSSQDGKYSEDLSALRPKVEETVTPENTATSAKRDPKAHIDAQFTVNRPLEAVLDSIDRINLSRKFIEGYTIQVYSGNKQDALNVKKQFALSIPNVSSDVHYEQPNYKVKAGKYYTRLEAQKDFEQIRKYFPSAILVPGQINLN